MVLKAAMSDRSELMRRGKLAREIVENEFMPDRVYRPFFDTFLPPYQDNGGE